VPHSAFVLSCFLQAFSDAEKLVDGSINFVHAAKNALLELDAWRLSHGSAGKLWKRQQQQQQDADDTAATNCDRWAGSHTLMCSSWCWCCCCPCQQITSAGKGEASALC
jgi:hypothetical protein